MIARAARNVLTPSPLMSAAGGGVVVLCIAVLDGRGPAWAPLAVAPLVLVMPWGAALGLMLGLAASNAWLEGDAVGPLSAIDCLLLLLIARAPFDKRFWRTPLRLGFVLGACALAAGAVATLGADDTTEVTAYLRVATYLGVALAASRVLQEEDVFIVASAFVGVALGQAIGALAGLTSTGPTSFPIGRYLGTLGDPNQFGTPIAAALLMLVVSPALLPRRILRFPAMALLAVALIGSGTRSAWAAAAISGTVMLAMGIERRGVRPGIRFAVGFILGALVVALCVVATLGASSIGLEAYSTQIRLDTISAGWDYLATHPFLPRGLGDYSREAGIYNTWLAVAVALSPVFAVFLGGFAALSTVASRHFVRAAILPACLVVAVTSLTENVVQGASSLTFWWLLLLGCGAAAERPLGALERSTPPGPGRTAGRLSASA